MCIDSQYIPVDESQMEHVEATEEEAEEFFQALENTPKPTIPAPTE